MLLDTLLRVLFLIGIAAVGYVAAKRLQVRAKDLSTLLIYVISPMVYFSSLAQSPAQWSYFGYSLATFCFSSVVGIVAYGIGLRVWGDARANLFGFSGGTGNTGYFGLPLMFAMFDPQQIAIVLFMLIGVNIYEFTVGYFITARGSMDVGKSLRSIARLPFLYAAVAGVLFKSAGLTLQEPLVSSFANFKGAFGVLGMLVIGITAGTLGEVRLDKRFVLYAVTWKHVIVPIVGMFLCGVLLGLPPDTLAIVAVLLSCPMAANTVVLANHLDVAPEQAAGAVMVSTALAAVSVPVMVTLFS